MHNTLSMDVVKELKHAEQELLMLERKKADIERQMRGWIQVIEGLRVLNDRERYTLDEVPTRAESATETETPSLPSKILAVLCQAGGPISAPQIRVNLIANRAADASSKNLLINIHTTLKRLIKTGQVEELPFSETTKLYRYVSPMEQALKAPVYTSGMRGNEKPKPGFTPPPKVNK